MNKKIITGTSIMLLLGLLAALVYFKQLNIKIPFVTQDKTIASSATASTTSQNTINTEPDAIFSKGVPTIPQPSGKCGYEYFYKTVGEDDTSTCNNFFVHTLISLVYRLR